MRSILLAPVCALVLGLCAYLGSDTKPESVKVRLKLVDAATGKAVGGMLRVLPQGKDEPVRLSGLYSRLTELKQPDAIPGWYVLPPKGAETSLPRTRLRIEAVSGLETALARQEIDLSAGAPAEVAVKLSLLFRPERE